MAEGGDGQHAIRALEWILDWAETRDGCCVETGAQPGRELFMRSCPSATNCRHGVRSWENGAAMTLCFEGVESGDPARVLLLESSGCNKVLW